MSVKATTVKRARQLRRKMTLPEVLLWKILRTSPDGLKFRRQHPVGRYVLDFYCPDSRTAIEIDGMVHDMDDNPEHDAARDAWLLGEGIAVVRIPAREVLRSVNDAAEAIVAACRQR